jgi:zinc protease
MTSATTPVFLFWAALFAAPISPPPTTGAAAVASAHPGAVAAPTDLFAHSPTVDTFDNGLTLVTLPFDAPGTVAYFTLVRAGSRDEVEPGKSGYAHLFEHLMFRGSEKMSAAEYERQMQAFGADNNASTSNDFTIYVPTLPKESLPDLIRIDADRFMHLSYKENAYKDETGAVLGEYNKNASSPLLGMEEALRAMAFTVHSYGHTTLGWKRDVEAMPAAYEYSRAFFKRFYTPDDCTLFAVGDVDRAAVKALVQAAYGGWSGHRAVTPAKVEPEQTAPRTRAVTWKGPTLPRILEGFKIPATGASIPDAAALSVVEALTFGDSSDLYQRLVVKEQKLVSLSADPSDVFNRDPGLLTVEAKLKAETTFDEIVRAIDDALAKVARGETPLARLEATRSHLGNELVLALQTPQAVGSALARWTAVTGDVHALEAYKKALAVVSAEDLARVTKAYLVPARRNVVTLSGPPAGAAR